MPLHKKYRDNLREAADFQDFVTDTLMHCKKVLIGVYQSRHYQFAHGESFTGVEIKFDRKFRLTGNLYIETSERHSAEAEWKDAGIYHKADPWLIVIGDYREFWAIATQTLRNIHDRHLYKEVENASKTGRGFLLPVKKADKERAFKWEADCGTHAQH